MAANIAAAAAAAQEVDPVLKKAVKLLHSSNSTSASELRLLLDEALKIRFGPDKIVTSNMTQRMMDDEANFPGRAATPPQPINTDEIINLTNSPDKDSVDTIVDSDDGLSAVGIVNTGDTGDFGDLNCCVCGEMVFTATNRLIECSKCGAMYHQECHKPPITKEEAADDQEQTWQCDTCQNKPTTSRAATSAFSVGSASSTVFVSEDPVVPLTSKRGKSSLAGGSSSSTSSNSSSPFYRPEPSSSTNASSSSSSKHCHKSSSSSSSKSHKEERSSKSSVAPSLSTISSHDKPSASSTGSGNSSSKRGSSKSSSSKSSSSKHHESSSSSSSNKRRSKQ